MCGRYSNHVRAMHDWAALLGDWPVEIPLSHNASPTSSVPVFTGAGGFGMRWGLIPNWAVDANSKYSTFNARAESVASKPAFKHAWRQSQRCLLPARGYYEWHLEEGAKQPYFVNLPPEIPMIMAGLFEPARGTDIPASCTILTCSATGPMARLHNRVPVMLPISLAAEWFAASPHHALTMLSAGQDLPLKFYPVSKMVNNARNDDDDLINPIVRTAAML